MMQFPEAERQARANCFGTCTLTANACGAAMSNTPSSTERLSEGGLLMRLMRLHSTAGAARLSAMASSDRLGCDVRPSCKKGVDHVTVCAHVPGLEPRLECELITTGLANWVHLEGSYRWRDVRQCLRARAESLCC
jgi:hypothetical protein